MALIKTNARSSSQLDATILTGNLPAISGASLTGLSNSFLQYKYTTLGTNDTSIASTSFTDVTGASLTFTPTSASSKLLIEFNCICNTNTTNVNNGIKIQIYNTTDSAVLTDGSLNANGAMYSVASATADYIRVRCHFSYVHPSWGTSEKSIKVQAAGTINTDQIRFNRSTYGQYSMFSVKEMVAT
tara:strand:- start:854 stop:1411 length:558 start_codon:yes stop_codon:yes gene_type:complete